jgi:uncharacterized membrane protein YhaH (DUF805 family)
MYFTHVKRFHNSMLISIPILLFIAETIGFAWSTKTLMQMPMVLLSVLVSGSGLYRRARQRRSVADNAGK